jgi:TusA-related sulfurtransferase
MELENERIERLRVQRMGEDWIKAITDGAPGRLEKFCLPDLISHVLTPKRSMTLENAAALVAKYQGWFGNCTDFRVEERRISRVGERLGIFYRFYLQEQGNWFSIEQQLYCKLSEDRVEQLWLLCSGFQLVGTNDGVEFAAGSKSVEQDPVRDGLLEFHTEALEAGSTCAILTPAIRSKLHEMESGQVLEVRVDDPTARDDIEAWTRLSGNPLLKLVDNEGPELRFFVQKK